MVFIDANSIRSRLKLTPMIAICPLQFTIKNFLPIDAERLTLTPVMRILVWVGKMDVPTVRQSSVFLPFPV